MQDAQGYQRVCFYEVMSYLTLGFESKMPNFFEKTLIHITSKFDAYSHNQQLNILENLTHLLKHEHHQQKTDDNPEFALMVLKHIDSIIELSEKTTGTTKTKILAMGIVLHVSPFTTGWPAFKRMALMGSLFRLFHLFESSTELIDGAEYLFLQRLGGSISALVVSVKEWRLLLDFIMTATEIDGGYTLEKNAGDEQAAAKETMPVTVSFLTQSRQQSEKYEDSYETSSGKLRKPAVTKLKKIDEARFGAKSVFSW
ncbi:hypothetical protein HDV05_005493 [Chytridiales sp. JEL 0842]|nr:hypothetical protein HDV05_005493 [Chytridiales sp. JEL 0842]